MANFRFLTLQATFACGLFWYGLLPVFFGGVCIWVGYVQQNTESDLHLGQLCFCMFEKPSMTSHILYLTNCKGREGPNGFVRQLVFDVH